MPEPYNGAFTAAGKAYNVNPVVIAALFTQEHFTNQPASSIAGSWAQLIKTHPDPNSGWATSPDHAQGPFQFIPPTWASLGVDADGNGVKDVQNLLDDVAAKDPRRKVTSSNKKSKAVRVLFFK